VITATSTVDTTKSGTFTVTVQPPVVTPKTFTLNCTLTTTISCTGALPQ
jgi:hypothetical protein